jgi:hypothetical protein
MNLALRRAVPVAALVPLLYCATASAFAANISHEFESDGCTTLGNSEHADDPITEVELKCAMRGVAAHCGLEFKTEHGTYALAQNSKTVPGPVSTAGCIWCQSGGVPMKDSKANGNCGGCGGWEVAGPGKDKATGTFKSLKDFMKDVKSYGDSNPKYNLAACETHSSDATNCQQTAATLYKKLTGKKASKCTACDPSCF